MIITFNCDEAVRIDKYLASLEIERLYSRSYIEKLLKEEKILVNNMPIKKNYLLMRGDVIEIEQDKMISRTDIMPENFPLDVVYEDEYLAIINKQAGISVHPSSSEYSGTIVNALVNRFGTTLPSLGNEQRPGIVHRLDKNTSGLMLIAKDERTLSLLSQLFSKREVGKHYKALVIGYPEPPTGEIETMIGRNTKDRTKMAVVGHGKTAITQYRTEQIIGPFSLLDITLLTGRTHQIRVHLDHIGCPIVGDETYGHKKLINKVPQMYRKRVENYIKKNMNRQALHSYRLTFTHPITKELIDIKTDLPSDIQSCLSWMSGQFTEED